MAAVNTIEVKPTITVTGLPPRPNHVIPKFHNRSNLFPSTFTNKLYEEAQTTTVNRQAWSADPRRRKPVAEQVSLKPPEITGCKIEDKTCNSLKRNKQKRRPISAKARLESVKTISASKTKSPEICKELVPVNGKDVPVVDIGDNAPFPTYHFMFNAKEKYVSDDTKPFLPGVTDNRVPNIDLCHPSILATTTAPEIKPVVYGLNSHQVVFGTDFEEEVHNIKYDLTEPKFTKKEERPLPSTLEPLRSWLTENKSIPGVKDCLIFLPSLENYGDLPEVPPPHSVHEDLPFKEKLPQEQQTTTKKYHHPAFDKKHVEEWVCNHSRPGTVNSRTDHQNYQPFYRSVGEIRTEITELENLMQGLGNLDSDCGMVKFQGEIDRFRKMYKETMKMVPERLLHSPKEQDTFGVKEFLKQHVDIMNEVRRKHTLCLEELRLIEAESGIDSSRKYFKYRTFPPDT